MGKESYSRSWLGIAGTASVLLALLEILMTVFWALLTALPVQPGGPIDSHYYIYSGAVTLFLSLIVVSSVIAIILGLVFCRGSFFLGRKYNVPVMSVAGVAFVLRQTLGLFLNYAIFSWVQMNLGGVGVPLSFVAFLADFSFLFVAVELLATILLVMSSFRMHDRTKVIEFHVAVSLFLILVFLEAVLVGMSYSVTVSLPNYYFPLMTLPIVPPLLGAFLAGSFIVFGVALREVAGSNM